MCVCVLVYLCVYVLSGGKARKGMISAEWDSVYCISACLSVSYFWVTSVSCYWSDDVFVCEGFFFCVFFFMLSVERAD